MRLVGQKYLKYTNQFRQMHHTMHMQKIKTIMKTQKSTMHFEKRFPHYPIQYTWNHKNMPLHVYAWQPVHQKPKALLINFNALNSHTGLSGKMAQVLAQSGIMMTGMDYPNFGRSHSPNPGHIQSINQLVEISEQFLNHTINKYPGVPVFLNGLSMGGIIAFQVGLRKPTLVNGCILLNPAFKDNPVNNGFLKKVVMFWGRLFPKFQTMKPIRSHSSKHSLQKYKHVDPYMYSGKLWTSTTWALLSNMRSISKRQKFQQFTVPFLCIQGGTDKVLNPFTVFQLEQNSKSVDKQIVIIPDLWHALWFDDHHDQVTSMVQNWILDRVGDRNQIKTNQQNKQKKYTNQQIGRHVHHPKFHSQISTDKQKQKIN